MTFYFQGLGLGIGLIVAIGAQNAFVLTQSIRRNYGLVAACICIMIDVLLISFGVGGFGQMLSQYPALMSAMSWAGATYLCWFGLSCFRRALQSSALEVDQQSKTMSLQKVVLVTLAVSLLNPHVYLDTLILLGSLSATLTEGATSNGWIQPHWWFGLGAMSAGFCWFLSLAFAGRQLSRFFAKPKAWQILDCLIGLTMMFLAASLIATQL